MKEGRCGMMLESEEVVITASGRQTTPFPKFKKFTRNLIPKVDKWLFDNAILEAQYRKDDWNLAIFKLSTTPKNMSQSDKDCAEMYLFEQQPRVLRLVKPTDMIG